MGPADMNSFRAQNGPSGTLCQLAPTTPLHTRATRKDAATAFKPHVRAQYVFSPSLKFFLSMLVHTVYTKGMQLPLLMLCYAASNVWGTSLDWGATSLKQKAFYLALCT